MRENQVRSNWLHPDRPRPRGQLRRAHAVTPYLTIEQIPVYGAGQNAHYCFLCVPEGDGKIGRNEPLRPLKCAEFTDKILKISGFSDPQWGSGSIGESSRKFAMCLQLGAKQTVLGILPGAMNWIVKNRTADGRR
jgi:hypothetical protein